MPVAVVSLQLGVHTMMLIYVLLYDYVAVEQELREQQLRLGIKLKRLLQDVRTRWSSTFLSISTLCENSDAVHAVCAMHAPKGSLQKRQRTAPVNHAAVQPTASADMEAQSTQAAATTVSATGHKTNARTRSQSKVLVPIPGALAGMQTDSEYYSSSDDGSVDLDHEGNRIAGLSETDSSDDSEVSSSSGDENGKHRKNSRSSNAAGKAARGRGAAGKAVRGRGVSERGRGRGRDRGNGRGRGPDLSDEATGMC